HRVTGDRSQRSRNWMRPETRVGYDYAHAIVDDHSRLAYVELEPYRPRTNGKVERFHQTIAREWAYGLSHRSHRQRNQALPHRLPLQHAKAAQLTRRPATHQPRSQRPWVGHLVGQRLDDRRGTIEEPAVPQVVDR